ncbi:hypothetical protein C0J52_11236 [Blattella germanica]|nr:hypothetical protein C0J52_11236 [Blattella germanica]
MVIERQNTIVITFIERDTPRPNAYDIHEWIHNTLKILPEGIAALQLNGITRQVYIKCKAQALVEKILLDTNVESYYIQEGGQRTKFTIDSAGLGIRRSELLHLVATNKPQPIYSTDTILRENGFIPVRLPPYHPDLNPIELIWNMVKRKVSEKNMSRVPLSELKQNTRDAFSTITKVDWIGAIRHVNQISDDCWTRDGLLEEELDRIIINVGIDSTDESSDDAIQRESATDSSATDTADTSATESGDEVTTFMNMGVERL